LQYEPAAQSPVASPPGGRQEPPVATGAAQRPCTPPEGFAPVHASPRAHDHPNQHGAPAASGVPHVPESAEGSDTRQASAGAQLRVARTSHALPAAPAARQVPPTHLGCAQQASPASPHATQTAPAQVKPSAHSPAARHAPAARRGTQRLVAASQ